MMDIYAHLYRLLQSGKQGVVVTVTEASGSVPRHAGSKMIVLENGEIVGSIGGGKLEKDATSDALKLLPGRQCLKKLYVLTEEAGVLCGGKVELLFEPFGSPESLFIFGAGHIARELAPLSVKAGFLVTVVDNRPEFATRERFPDPIALSVGEYDRVLPQLPLNEKSYLVIVTHGHLYDEEILAFCLKQSFAYLGMIGSRRKTGAVFKKMQELGFSKEELQKVHSPIGLNIGAETPFEIAVSILAEILAHRSGVDVSAVSMKLDY